MAGKKRNGQRQPAGFFGFRNAENFAYFNFGDIRCVTDLALLPLIDGTESRLCSRSYIVHWWIWYTRFEPLLLPCFLASYCVHSATHIFYFRHGNYNPFSSHFFVGIHIDSSPISNLCPLWLHILHFCSPSKSRCLPPLPEAAPKPLTTTMVLEDAATTTNVPRAQILPPVNVARISPDPLLLSLAEAVPEMPRSSMC